LRGGAHAFSWLVAAVLALLSSALHVQPKDVSIYDEQRKPLRGSESVSALGPDLFGDQVSLYTGSLEFVQTDVSLPGNSGLPVANNQLPPALTIFGQARGTNHTPGTLKLCRSGVGEPKMKALLFLTVALSLVSSAVAQPAYWYIWTSKTTGKTTCAQVMQGEWTRGSTPYKDARCEKPAN